MSDLDAVLMRIDTIVVDPKTDAPVMVLRGELDGGIYLPICIGQLEAAAIASVLADFTLPRPMTHDLFSRVIETLGGHVNKVTITRLEDDTFYAEITVTDLGGQTRIIDARPSDSVALALRADAPIYVAEDVLAEAGGYAEEESQDGEEGFEDIGLEVAQIRDVLPGAKTDEIRLEDLDADTFGKYKM